MRQYMSLINKQAQTQYPGPVGLKIPLGIESINIPDPGAMHLAQALLRLSWMYAKLLFRLFAYEPDAGVLVRKLSPLTPGMHCGISCELACCVHRPIVDSKSTIAG
jgi:hypothetical protein